MSSRQHPYADFIHDVVKPARYVGGEHQSVVKDWSAVDATLALCFPDVYDVGMSHLGTKILYDIVNRQSDLLLERVFCPWLDMEAELRRRGLPLVSLETHRPLHEFDIVGFSLQYELTFTNVLTMLDLGGVPIHNVERSLDDPLIIAGGPVATQPEPMAPFIDLFLIGDAEDKLPSLMRSYADLKRRESLSRIEILIELARQGGVYCPDLYEREICDRSGLMVVGRPKYAGVPGKVERAVVDDLRRHPFPDASPVPVAEAIFDRMAIEIARGCTEGCRFCQAGMIYRPVRERDPEQVVSTLVSAVEKGGYDEAAVTSLSTADYSCVSPLVKKAMERLRPKKIGLGISSLRAYGLDEDLLDAIASVKATGLTFAPEAGTQRLRDVINKNISEGDIFTTCHRVFSRGWNRVKLYFMIGLPTERDEDVIGIAEMGRQALQIGRTYQRRVQVTVSVSSHVPKPHTPFQWCAMDTMEELERKQHLLKGYARRWRFNLRHHDTRVSHLEGIIGRGDYRTGALLETAWRAGARFDGWDEQLSWQTWRQALETWEGVEGLSRQIYVGALPLDGRLPWDHIHVGLEDGFLAREYKRALKGRASPPCGKPYQAKVHPTNLEDAEADERQLVCYHCGVACDLTQMREERKRFLKTMGALERPESAAVSLRQEAVERIRKGDKPHDFAQGSPIRYRLRYSKLPPMTLRGHLDMVRVLPRIFRRAGLPLYYSEGFNPRPIIAYGPALALGMRSVAEYTDIALGEEVSPTTLLDALASAAEPGLVFTGIRRVAEGEPSLSEAIRAMDVLARLPVEGDVQVDLQAYRERCRKVLSQETVEVTVRRKNRTRVLDLKDLLIEASVEWSDFHGSAGIEPGGPAALLRLRVGGASLRPEEITKALFDVTLSTVDLIRLHCWHVGDRGELLDPLGNAPSSLEGKTVREAPSTVL